MVKTLHKLLSLEKAKEELLGDRFEESFNALIGIDDEHRICLPKEFYDKLVLINDLSFRGLFLRESLVMLGRRKIPAIDVYDSAYACQKASGSSIGKGAFNLSLCERVMPDALGRIILPKIMEAYIHENKEFINGHKKLFVAASQLGDYFYLVNPDYTKSDPDHNMNCTNYAAQYKKENLTSRIRHINRWQSQGY